MLFLDVWMGPDGKALLLDEEELDEALGREWVDRATADSAREEAMGLVEVCGTAGCGIYKGQPSCKTLVTNAAKSGSSSTIRILAFCMAHLVKFAWLP